MAFKKIFRVGDENSLYFEELIEYKYYQGFAVSQRQKCIQSLHRAISGKYPGNRPLEISTKSLQALGVSLSAFNLRYPMFGENITPSVECVFQSSKKFESGGPYVDLLGKTSREAKKDNRLQESGKLVAFELSGKEWPLIPQTLFYDWIYINALYMHPELVAELEIYDIFTDIEFNHKKSINCQARSAAIYQTLVKRGILEDVIKERIDLRKLY